MKLPRDLSGSELAKALGRVGYRIVRQSGSHLRLTAESSPATPSQFRSTALSRSVRSPRFSPTSPAI